MTTRSLQGAWQHERTGLRRFWMGAALVTLAELLQPALAISQSQGDLYSPQGQSDPFAVGGAQRWYDHHTTEFKQNSSHCLPLLQEAKAFQDKGLALFEEAKPPGNSRRQSELVKQGNEQIKRRGEKLKAFTNCVNQANRHVGEKGIAREQPTPPGQSDPGNVATMLEVVDRCLRNGSQLQYYVTPPMAPYVGTVSYDGTGIRYDPAYLSRQTPYARTFLLARQFASYVLSERQRLYGIDPGDAQLVRDSDVIVGFITRCFRDMNALQKERRDPREQFADYLIRYEGVGASQQAWERTEEDFGLGWGLYGAGLPRSITME
ncbi:MAG TPA: hypothetical protein VFS39_03355 [Nitrospira sp.]|nr:hypothetical protein [Nitrospira sp.]